jgi:hypothetical protein
VQRSLLKSFPFEKLLLQQSLRKSTDQSARTVAAQSTCSTPTTQAASASELPASHATSTQTASPSGLHSYLNIQPANNLTTATSAAALQSVNRMSKLHSHIPAASSPPTTTASPSVLQTAPIPSQLLPMKTSTAPAADGHPSASSMPLSALIRAAAQFAYPSDQSSRPAKASTWKPMISSRPGTLSSASTHIQSATQASTQSRADSIQVNIPEGAREIQPQQARLDHAMEPLPKAMTPPRSIQASTAPIHMQHSITRLQQPGSEPDLEPSRSVDPLPGQPTSGPQCQPEEQQQQRALYHASQPASPINHCFLSHR